MNKAQQQNSRAAQFLTGAGARPTPTSFEAEIRKWWADGNAKRMETLCGSADVARKLLVTAINVVSKTPRLVECDFSSFINCLLQSAELGLFPGAMQECAYVPRINRRSGRIDANFEPMYQGLVKLAYNSGVVKSLSCDVAYEADEFEFELGTRQFLRHVPFHGDPAERGARRCVYACVLTTFGEWQIRVVSMSFIEGIKARSAAARGNDSPWNNGEDNYDAMARKTALKQALKFIPKSDKLATAIELDNASERPDLARSAVVDLSGLSDAVARAQTATQADLQYYSGDLALSAQAALPESTGTVLEPAKERGKVAVVSKAEEPNL